MFNAPTIILLGFFSLKFLNSRCAFLVSILIGEFSTGKSILSSHIKILLSEVKKLFVKMLRPLSLRCKPSSHKFSF